MTGIPRPLPIDFFDRLDSQLPGSGIRMNAKLLQSMFLSMRKRERIGRKGRYEDASNAKMPYNVKLR